MKKPRIAGMCPGPIIKIIHLLVLAVVFITAIFVGSAQAVNYYVSTAGNDGNAGTTWATAFRSLQRAANAATAAGDVITVADGTYSYWDNSALCNTARALTGDNYMAVCMLFYSGITLRAQNRGLARIIGSNESFGGNVCSGIQIWGGAPYNQGCNITIDGFEIDGRDSGGVMRIQDGICLNTSASNNIIQYNNVHNCSRNGICIGKTIGGGGDYDAHGYCNFNAVRYNTCYSISTAGLYEYASAGNTVEYNLFRDNMSYGIEIYACTAAHNQSVYRYNICYSNNYGLNIDYKNEVGTGGNPTIAGANADTRVEYCTFANNSRGFRSGAGYVLLNYSIIANNSISGIDESDNGWWDGCTDIKGDYNCVYNNGTNYSSTSVGPTGDSIHPAGFANDINADPQFLTIGTGVWATSYQLRNKYTPTRVDTGQGLTSPCIDRSQDAEVAPDLRGDLGAHRNAVTSAVNYIGYPNPPSALGLLIYVGGANSWTNVPWLVGSANLEDPVEPDIVERVRYEFDVSYEKAYSAGGNIVWAFVWNLWSPLGGSYPYTANWVSATLPAIAGCGEGQFYWRVRCEDNVKGNSGNISNWTYGKGVEGADLVAFGIDVTKPPAIADLAGTTTVDASSTTLTWKDINDNPATCIPATPAPINPATGSPYLRESQVSHYIIYRGTFTVASVGGWSTWKALVAAGSTAHQSKIIIEPRGTLAAGSAHLKVNAPGAGVPFVDGQVVGDELLDTQSYTYVLTSVDYAGNESIQGKEITITPGNIGGGGDLEYIYDTANLMPRIATTQAGLPGGSVLYLDEAVGTSLNQTGAATNSKNITNEFWVRHYARIRMVTPANYTEEVRFYYTVGTFSTSVYTNVATEPGSPNYYVKGVLDTVLTTARNDGYKYFYADFPVDIHACGVVNNSASPDGVVGVRVSGCQANKDPITSTNWIVDTNNKSYTYYVKKTGSCDGNYSGEKDNNVRPEATKHDWNARLTNLPASPTYYFMPDGNSPTNLVGIAPLNRRMDPVIPDTRPDIFYGEIPDLYLRFAYRDGDGANTSHVLSWKCDDWANTAQHNSFANGICNWIDIFASIESVKDDQANNGFAGGFTGNPAPDDFFYGHYGLLKVNHDSSHVNITDLGLVPESARVDYIFKIIDGSKTLYSYNASVSSHTTTTQSTAEADPYTYYVLQDDLSRPRAVTHPENGQSGVWASPGTWSSGGTYTVRINIEDIKANTNDIYGNTGFGNVIADRGNDSGIYGINSTGYPPATASVPVHATRVYYRFANAQEADIDNDNYPDNVNFITAVACGDAANSPNTAFVDMVGPGGATGNGIWQGSFTLGAETQFIYYRVYACNNDAEPQAYIVTSSNTFTSVGGAAAILEHGTTGAAVLGNPNDPANRDLDRDHGWVTPTRYGGTITAARMIRIISEADVNGTKKIVVTDVSAEDSRPGNIISHEITNKAP